MKSFFFFLKSRIKFEVLIMPKKYEVIVYDSFEASSKEYSKEELQSSLESIAGHPRVSIEEIPYHPNREQVNKKVVDDIFKAINFMGNWKDLAAALTKHINTEHPTLIQGFFRTVQKVIENYARDSHCDARNKGSLDWAMEVAKIKSYMPEI